MSKFIWRILILISTSYGIYGGVYMAAGESNSGFLLYYTTQSNLWCFVFFLYLMITNRKHPWIKGGITVAIIVTFILYQFVIVPYCLKYGSMHQLFSMEDIAVHYLSPFLVFMDAILFDKGEDYSWYTPFQWLLIPILYFSYIVGRTFFHRPVPEPNHPYLYFFLDIQNIGTKAFIYNLIGIAITFLAVGYFVVLIHQIKTRTN